ncbi:acyltransferase [Pseudoalteromonas shioyasakiensis]|uniref:acyltransferase n=1 Tax=Pseudoalteromonas shioyasakiensis TaxID=1190813 RepID=UPI0022B14DF9|nr:acyltransferase [Pseudoalteromonas shioyasakiensis]MCZ4253666.1 acyltransferase [Pseudoalteromonas shioyasakiensis]
MNFRKILANIRYKYFERSKVYLAKGISLHYGGTFITTEIDNVNLKGITIDNNVYIGRYFNLHTASSIHLSENVVLSDYVYISTLAHGLNPLNGPVMSQKWEDKGEVFIGENTFIGFGAVILPGVSLGKNCVVGSGSIVTKSFPDFTMLSGNPARVIKRFCFEKNEWQKAQ